MKNQKKMKPRLRVWNKLVSRETSQLEEKEAESLRKLEKSCGLRLEGIEQFLATTPKIRK